MENIEKFVQRRIQKMKETKETKQERSDGCRADQAKR